MTPIARPTRMPRRVKFWGSEERAARMSAGEEVLGSSDSFCDGDGGVIRGVVLSPLSGEEVLGSSDLLCDGDGGVIRGVVSPLSGAIVGCRLGRGLGEEVRVRMVRCCRS